MFKFKHRTSCILTVLTGIISIQVGNAITVPWLRPYINGEEVVGTTLESRYSTPDGESANPVIRWEKADVRNGKTVVVQQSRDAESYTLTDKDAGKYFRIIVGCGTKDEAASQWIGPVITEKQAESINNRFHPGRSYQENVNELQKELSEKLRNAVYFTVDTDKLHGAPCAMARNKRIPLPEDIRPFRENGKIYISQPFVQAIFNRELPDEIMEEAAGQKAYEISNVARVLQLNL